MIHPGVKSGPDGCELKWKSVPVVAIDCLDELVVDEDVGLAAVRVGNRSPVNPGAVEGKLNVRARLAAFHCAPLEICRIVPSGPSGSAVDVLRTVAPDHSCLPAYNGIAGFRKRFIRIRPVPGESCGGSCSRAESDVERTGGDIVKPVIVDVEGPVTLKRIS